MPLHISTIKRKDRKTHFEHIIQVFERIEEYGFKLGAEKCEFFMSEIKYLGQIIDSDGRRPDPARAEAIKSMSPPQNVVKLQAFLGLANYYGIYIPKMHNLRALLNKLLKKGAIGSGQKCVRKRLTKKKKNILTSELSLTHHDPKQEIIMASDASEYGIGAVILHKFKDGNTKPVAHASKTLLPAKKKYS